MKKIWFTQRVVVKNDYGERWDAADQRISKMIVNLGYLPIAIPNDIDALQTLTNEICPDGVLLTGGNSLVKYGGDAPERDLCDKWLLEYAVSLGKPLLGICRGMQSVLDYAGCTLVPISNHVRKKHNIYGSIGERVVNSFHSQGCYDCNIDRCKILARSEDRVVEAVKYIDKNVWGIMWHPERESVIEKEDAELIKLIFGDS